MSPIQIILILVALAVVIRVFRQYKKQKIAVQWFFFWVGFWAIVILISLTPQTADVFAELVGVGRGADLIIYLSLVLIFVLLYRLGARVDQLNSELTELVRKIAIDKAKKPEDNSNKS